MSCTCACLTYGAAAGKSEQPARADWKDAVQNRLFSFRRIKVFGSTADSEGRWLQCISCLRLGGGDSVLLIRPCCFDPFVKLVRLSQPSNRVEVKGSRTPCDKINKLISHSAAWRHSHVQWSKLMISLFIGWLMPAGTEKSWKHRIPHPQPLRLPTQPATPPPLPS